MISTQELMRGYKLDPQRCQRGLREALRRGTAGEPGGIRMEEVSFKDLAVSCLGYQAVNDLFDPRKPINRRQLREAEDAVDSTGFSNITGQLIVNRVMQAFQNEAFIASRLVTTVPTRLDGEKIPGIARVADPNNDNADNLTVREGMPYPHAGFGEDYIATPSTTKRGLIVGVTREAIFFDRTGLVAQRAGEVGEILGLDKEKRLLDMVAGLVDLYSWRGTTYQTYYGATDSANWINHLDGNQLVSWQDIDDAELLFADMLDPNTGEPIILGLNRTLLCTPHLKTQANRVLTAAETRDGAGNITIVAGASLPVGYSIESSSLLYRRMINGGITAENAKATWFFGDLNKAFAYMENWPITVTQSGMDSEVAFNQDIVLRFKASERGAAAVMEPRAMTRHRALAGSSSSGT